MKKSRNKNEALWIAGLMLPGVAFIGSKGGPVSFGLFIGLLSAIYAIGLFLLIRGKKNWTKYLCLALTIALTLVIDHYYVKISTFNRENGLKTTYYLNGNLKDERTLIKGERQGPWTKWYRNGTLQEKGYFVDDQASGKWTYYDEYGNKDRQGVYIDNLRTGIWEAWYPNGKIQTRGTYIRDILNGKWIMHYEDGSLAAEGAFLNGQYEGKWISIFEDKKVMLLRYYKSGRVKFEQYYEK